MMNVTGWTLTDATGALARFGLARERRPGRFRRAESPPVVVEADGWVAREPKLCVRFARVRGPHIDIATVMAYPTASPAALPIFAAEWVVVGQRCHALILDVETAGDQPGLAADLAKVFAPLGEKWQRRFPANPDAPDWFREIAEPWALFSACGVEEMGEVRAAFNEYLDAAVTHFYGPRWDTAGAGPDHAAVTAYKEHHYESSPGRKVMTPRFGAEFTEELLRDWHFGPAVSEPECPPDPP